jgi:hypothetical protein
MATATNHTAIDIAKVTGRRELHFNCLQDIAADVDKLAESKEFRTLGNWSAGQIFWHLATTMNGSIDGMKFVPPWYIKLVVRLFFKRRFLTKPMAPGFQLPRDAATELLPPPTGLEEGLDSIRKALARQQTETSRAPSPVLGQLSREEWDQLHCRHAELHLSFLVPVE